MEQPENYCNEKTSKIKGNRFLDPVKKSACQVEISQNYIYY